MHTPRTMWKLVLVLAVLACAASSVSASAARFSQLQRDDGGFAESREGATTVRATSQALELSHLFGVAAPLINIEAAEKFVRTAKNADGGYGASAGAASDVLSTHHALSALKAAGASPSGTTETVNFVKSLQDGASGLFALQAGGEPSYEATALSLAVLHALDAMGDASVAASMSKLHASLAAVAQSGDYAFFGAEGDYEANNWALAAAGMSGYSLGAEGTTKWAAYVASQQCVDRTRECFGGFFAKKGAVGASAKATAVATWAAMTALNGIASTGCNTDAMAAFALNQAGAASLADAFFATMSAVEAGKFASLVQTDLSYEVIDGSATTDQLMQGVQLKPVFTVQGADGFPVGNLDASVTVRYPGSSEGLVSKLTFDATTGRYAADQFYTTANYLGEMSFAINAAQVVPAFDRKVSVSAADTKRIGFGIAVTGKASLAGKELTDATVAIGTQFNFRVRLSTNENSNLEKGDFAVALKVLDSSNVAVHTDVINGKTNKGAIKFAYKLEAADLPAGALTFAFEVSDDKGAVHTKATRAYTLNLPMIATEIALGGTPFTAAPAAKLGDVVQVSMKPASLPDLSTVNAFDAAYAAQRAFAMDISSPSGVQIASVAGTADAAGVYTFAYTVPATFDSLNAQVLSFHYTPAAEGAAPIKLASYDSVNGETFDDAASVAFHVNTELQISDVSEQPKSTSFNYGSNVSYRFKIVDTVSGEQVNAGATEEANVYLVLQSTDGEHTFEVAREGASQAAAGADFVISWAVSANAVRGKGVLTLAVEDADGENVPLFAAGGKAVAINVEIGGDIDVESASFTANGYDATETVFLVQFELSCEGNPLDGADLMTSVEFAADGSSTFVPIEEQLEVNTFAVPVATSGHKYQVSWTAAHEKMATGTYKVQLYRTTDRQRYIEAQAYGAKDVELTPLVELAVEHVFEDSSSQWIKMEFVVSVVLAVAAYTISKSRDAVVKAGRR